MIFVTVGTQLPFDRLVAAVDGWAEANPDQEVFVQTAGGGLAPRHCETREALEPEAWRACFERAELVIAHAGIGTILACLEAGKPLIVVPREAARGEHRNDHQRATVGSLRDRPGIRVVSEVEALPEAIRAALTGPAIEPASTAAPRERLVQALRRFARAPEGA